MSGASRSSQSKRCARRWRNPLTLNVASLIADTVAARLKNRHEACVARKAMDPELRVTVLRRATDLAGGPAALRERLQVDEHSLELGLSGRATVPVWVFSVAVDLVLGDDVERAAQDRRTAPRA